MKSMTGFGRTLLNHNGLEITIEAVSVNKKNLEIFTSLPREWQSLDRHVQEVSRKFLKRGKVNITIKANDLNSTPGLCFDKEAIEGVLKQIAAIAPSTTPPSEELVLNIARSLGSEPSTFELDEKLQDALITSVEEVLQELSAMRTTEGEKLKEDIESRLSTLESSKDTIEKESQHATAAYKDQLMSRLAQSGLELDVNDDRVLREVALFADRSDISEEITRLSSHIEQLRSSLGLQEPIGRKLDFLCQELNRELNTIGSKTPLIEVTKIVIDSKNELERIREQIQNIE